MDEATFKRLQAISTGSRDASELGHALIGALAEIDRLQFLNVEIGAALVDLLERAEAMNGESDLAFDDAPPFPPGLIAAGRAALDPAAAAAARAAKDRSERWALWLDCFADELSAGGVAPEQIRKAETWADYVLSK